MKKILIMKANNIKLNNNKTKRFIMLNKKQTLMDLQQENQAQVGKKENMEVVMKNYMNLKFSMSSIKCIREMQN